CTADRPRGPRSGPGCSVPVRHHLIGLIRPTRRHTAISPHGGLYAMPSLCGGAEATREWFRAFTAHSFLTCRPLRPRGVRHRYPSRNFDADIGLRRMTTRNPFHAGGRFRGFTGSLPLQPARLLAPLYGSDWNVQPSGTFTSRLSTDRSPSPLLDITTTATGLLCWRDSHPLEWQLASLHGHSDRRRSDDCAPYMAPDQGRWDGKESKTRYEIQTQRNESRMRREKTATSMLDGAPEIRPLGAEAIKRWHLRSCQLLPTLLASLSSKSMSGRK